MKELAFRFLALSLGLVLSLCVLEGVLRLLPVSTGTFAEPVNAQTPVFRFVPNRDFTWSNNWNFSIVNRGHVNNAGFVNDQDYASEGVRPLIGVVGDSYVEAFQVPYAQTFHGRLAARLTGRARVFSFAASGAPLSQYLIWMRHARQTYDVDALLVTVVGNDFDESLAQYKVGPGLHHYVEGPDGLVMRRFDYAPGRIRPLVEASALARYLLLNLHADHTLSRALRGGLIADAGAAEPPGFIGNVPAQVDQQRLRQSQRAVLAFFQDLPDYAGLPAERILFVLDGLRYPANAAAEDSYFGQMRRYFSAEARRLGYPVIDADDSFMPYARNVPEARFEWPSDGHWNALAHGLIAEAVLASTWIDRFLP
jgi:hypothetical protein